MGRKGKPPRDPAWYAEVGATLEPSVLQAPGPAEADALDEALRGDLHADERALFLGYYTGTGLGRALETYGFLDLIRARGFPHLRVALEPVADAQPRLRVYGGRAPEDEQLLVDVHARTGRWRSGATEVREVIFIEWVALRDPRKAFTRERPRLPGQDAPGLGVGWEVLQLLVQASMRLGKEALVAWPDHFHNAVLYGRRMRYHDPRLQGCLDALIEAAADHPLADASWAIEWGCLKDARTGEPLAWSDFRGEQVLPLAQDLARQMESPSYRRAADAARRDADHRFDWDAFESLRASREVGP